MSTLLRIDSSIFGENGVSSQLAGYFQERLLEKRADMKVVHRKLAEEPIPHFDGQWLQALMTPESDRSDGQKEMVALSDQLIAELKEADALVLTAPMYNFHLPSAMKAWFDHVARAGETFKYTENGPVGLLEDKPVYVLTTRGGQHKGQPTDTLVSYLTTMLGFLGLKDIEFIFAEALNMGDELKGSSIEEAKKTIDGLI